MGTHNNKSVSNSGGEKTRKSSSENGSRSTYASVEKRAVKNPVPGDGGKKK